MVRSWQHRYAREFDGKGSEERGPRGSTSRTGALWGALRISAAHDLDTGVAPQGALRGHTIEGREGGLLGAGPGVVVDDEAVGVVGVFGCGDRPEA